MGKSTGEKHYIIYRVDVFLPTEDVNNKRQIHVAVGDFIFLCVSVENTYDLGRKQYERKTLHYIQGGRIHSFCRSK